MILKLVQIGNSKGVRFPKNIIEKYKFSKELDVIETEEGLMIKPSAVLRGDWDAQFKTALAESSNNEEFTELVAISNDFDSLEWTW